MVFDCEAGEFFFFFPPSPFIVSPLLIIWGFSLCNVHVTNNVISLSIIVPRRLRGQDLSAFSFVFVSLQASKAENYIPNTSPPLFLSKHPISRRRHRLHNVPTQRLPNRMPPKRVIDRHEEKIRNHLKFQIQIPSSPLLFTCGVLFFHCFIFIVYFRFDSLIPF